ncbi:MAG: hypothetical protein AAF597_14400, partial [Bacteroidota bacterium]
RTMATAGLNLDFSYHRFTFSPGLLIRYDLNSFVREESYLPTGGATLSRDRNEVRLWELRPRGTIVRQFTSRELSRRFNPAFTFSFGYQLSKRIATHLMWQQTIGPVALTETLYRQRNTLAGQIDANQPQPLVNAAFRSMLLGISYRL